MSIALLIGGAVFLFDPTSRVPVADKYVIREGALRSFYVEEHYYKRLPTDYVTHFILQDGRHYISRVFDSKNAAVTQLGIKPNPDLKFWIKETDAIFPLTIIETHGLSINDHQIQSLKDNMSDQNSKRGQFIFAGFLFIFLSLYGFIKSRNIILQSFKFFVLK